MSCACPVSCACLLSVLAFNSQGCLLAPLLFPCPRFILLSEADIPLFDPLTFYQAALDQTLSRVNACPQLHNSSDRWHPLFEARLHAAVPLQACKQCIACLLHPC